MIDLNKLAAEIHEASVEKGFWDVEDAEEKHLAKMISELGEVVQADRAGIMYEVEREGAKPEGVVAELADFVMMLLDLNEVYGYKMPTSISIDQWMQSMPDSYIQDAAAYDVVMVIAAKLAEERFEFAIETAAMLLCFVYRWLKLNGHDLWDVIRQKMAYNESRPALHGRKY